MMLNKMKKYHHINHFAIMISVALLATGCVIKPYKTPSNIPIENDLYRGSTTSIDSANIATIPWNEFFSDPLLCSLIDSVLVNNIDLQVAIKNVEKSFQYLRQRRSEMAPSLSTGAMPGSMGSVSGLMRQHSTPSWSADVSLGATWEIDIWGKLLSAKRAAKADMMADADTYHAVMTTLIAETAKSYYRLIALDIERQIIKTTIINRSDYLQKMRDMKLSAMVNEVAVQQAVAQLAEVHAAMPEIELSIELLENRVSLLLGDVPQKIERSKIIDLNGVVFKDEIGYPVQLLSNRPDVRAAELNYRSAFELYNASRAALYPSLSLNAMGGFNSIMFSAVNAHFLSLNVGAGLVQPIFNGRKLRTQKNVSKLTAEQVELQFKQVILTAGTEVSNAMISVRKYSEKVTSQQVQLDALTKAYEYSNELFDNAYATYLDVLVAQTGVYNTQRALVNTSLLGINSRIDLYRALGGGISGLSEEVATK